MKPETIAGLALLLRYLWVFTVWGVTAYAVFWLDRSGWWFLLALIITSGTSTEVKVKK